MSQIHELDVLPCWFGTQIEATTLFEYPASNATISALNIIKSVCTNGVICRDKDILITGINAAALHLISQRGRSQRMEMSCWSQWKTADSSRVSISFMTAMLEGNIITGLAPLIRPSARFLDPPLFFFFPGVAIELQLMPRFWSFPCVRQEV